MVLSKFVCGGLTRLISRELISGEGIFQRVRSDALS